MIDQNDTTPRFYLHDDELPADVQELPRHPRRIWKSVYNKAGEVKEAPVESMTLGAWSAVLEKYERTSDGAYKHKADILEPRPAKKSFTKFILPAIVDEQKNLIWYRVGSETPDHDGEVMDYAASKPNFLKHSAHVEKLTKGKSKFNVRDMHNKNAIGIAPEFVARDEYKDFLAGIQITDPTALIKYQSGTYGGASVGGDYGRIWRDGQYTRYEAIPIEFSLVDVPNNPDAIDLGSEYELIKADGSRELRKFVGAKSMTKSILAKAAAVQSVLKAFDPDYAITETFDGNTASFLLSGLFDLARSEASQNEPDHVKALAYIIGLLQAFISEEVAEMVGTEPSMVVAEPIETPAELAAAIKPGTLAKVAKREDVTPADKAAALADAENFADKKNKKYKLDNEEEIRAAWNYIHQEKNAAEYSADDVKTIESNIIAAWKDKIDKAGPPSAETKPASKGAGMTSTLIKITTDHGDVVARIQQLRNAAELAGDFEQAELLTQSIATVMQAQNTAIEADAEPEDQTEQQAAEGEATTPPTPPPSEAPAVPSDESEPAHDQPMQQAAKVKVLKKTVAPVTAQLEKVLGDLVKRSEISDLAKAADVLSVRTDLMKVVGDIGLLVKAIDHQEERIDRLAAMPAAPYGLGPALRDVTPVGSNAIVPLATDSLSQIKAAQQTANPVTR